jgi:hypothetical protein
MTVVAGEGFTIRVGAKSSAGLDLEGRRVEVCGAGGTVIAFRELGSARWPGTSALHWTELSLPAPAEYGVASFSVRLAADRPDTPHRAASAVFAVNVVPPPEHTATIQALAQENAAPIADADIRLGPYRATTDAAGRAHLRVAAGQYELHLWKVGYEAPTRIVTVNGNVSVEVAAATVPEETADRAWKG